MGYGGAMIRLALVAALCAVVASPTIASAADAEKDAAKQYAKRVLVNRAKKAGINFRVSDVSASCRRTTDYWKCRAHANTSAGNCNAAMRLYNAAGPFHATKVVVGCTDPGVTAP
jgi:hypothetical protein